MRMASGAYEGPYSFQSRFEEGDGTNPEELIAAAHAGCFSMALSGELGNHGHEVESVETEARVHIDKVEGGFAIKRIELMHTRLGARNRRRPLPRARQGGEGRLPGIAGPGGRGVDRARRAADGLGIDLRPDGRKVTRFATDRAGAERRLPDSPRSRGREACRA